MQYALIGAGLIGRKRLACLAPEQVAVICDRDLSRARSLAESLGGGIATADRPEEVFARSDVDAVLVATLHDSLAPLALGAIRAGKHVLVEKPAARTEAELRPLIAEAEARRVVVRVGYNHRFHPAFQLARQIVDRGDLGPLLYLRSRYGHGGRLGYESEWRAKPEISGGGELIDQGVHQVDLARWFLGDLPHVRGTTKTYFWKSPVEDNAFLELQTAAGQTAWVHASCTEWKNMFSFELYGRNAKLQIDGLGGSYGQERLTLYRMKPEMGPPDVETHEFPATDSSWQLELAAFEQDVREDRTPSPGLRDAAAILAVVDAVYAQNRPAR